MASKRFGDFEPGQTYESQWRVVSEADFRRFLDLCGIREPLFEDEQFREEAGHEEWVVPGFLTASFSLGLFLRSGWFDRTGLAMLGAEEMEFENPVYVGDEIRTTVEVIDTHETSSDRGGVVDLAWETETRTETVLTLTSAHFIRK